MSRKPRAKAKSDEPLPLIEYGNEITKLITETDSDPDYERGEVPDADLSTGTAGASSFTGFSHSCIHSSGLMKPPEGLVNA